MTPALGLVAALSVGCPAVPGSASLMRPGAILLLGEIHGTEQAPALVEDLVCLAGAAGLEVLVGLELPTALGPALERYVASDGGDAARAALLAAPFFARDYQDGRSSRAMFALLESLRRRGSPVFAIDDVDAPAGRDAAMAAAVGRAADENPEALLVVLTGNLHNRLTTGTPWDPRIRPMGHRLAQSHGPRVVSLRITHAGGTAWVCSGGAPSDCGIRELRGSSEVLDRSVRLSPPGTDAPFSGEVAVGRIDASPPARD